MTESNAGYRVKAAISQRHDREQEYQSSWEESDKPTTITGTGVVRQLGATPLDSRQVLSNTTAGAGMPIAGAAVPGGVVGDWIPRFVEQPSLPPVGPAGPTTVIVIIQESESTSDVAPGHFFKDRDVVLLIDGRDYVELWSQVSPYAWRNTADPLTTLNETTGNGVANQGSTLGGYTASTSASATEPDSSTAYVTSFYYAPGFRGSVSALASSTATGAFLPPVSQAIFRSLVLDPIQEYGSTSIDGIGDPSIPQGQFSAVGEVDFADFNQGFMRARLFAIADRSSPPHGTPSVSASSSLTVTSLECVAHTGIDRTWAYIDERGWIAWVKTYEYQNNTAATYDTTFNGPEYLTEYFYGCAGSRTVQQRRVYARRSYWDGTKEYAIGNTDSGLTFGTTPIALEDFRENTKSVNLYWRDDTPVVPSNPCESDYAADFFTEYYKNRYFSISPIDALDRVTNGGTLDKEYGTAVVNELVCDIAVSGSIPTTVTAYEIPDGATISVEAAAWYRRG